MTRFYGTLSALTLSLASPAMADTLAAEVWAEWQEQAAATDQTITADVTETDTGLILENVVASFEDGTMSGRAEMDQVAMIENADGTLSITYSNPYTINLAFPPNPFEPIRNIQFLLSHENLNTQVSGDAGARVTSYSADRISIVDGDIPSDDAMFQSFDLDVQFIDAAGTYILTGTDPDEMVFTTEGSVGSLSMTLDIVPTSIASGRLKMTFDVDTLTATSSGALAALGDTDRFTTEIPEGFALAATTSYGDLAFSMGFNDTATDFTMTYENAGGRSGMDITEDAIAYDIAASGANLRITSGFIPIPINASTAASEISFSMPLSAGEDPQDVDIRVGVEDLILGEAIWASVDPGQAVPRDPINFLLDVGGQVQLFVDLLGVDPMTFGGAPGELRAVSVNEMRLSAGGAALTGTADLTFAPNQIVPMPEGQADVQLQGGNALLDALIAGGLLPAEQGLFIQGASAIFTRPGASPDTLETTLEFGPDGSITANGVPVQ